MEKLLSGACQLSLRLTEKQLLQFETYYHELISWNKRINLTAITSYEDVQTDHFLDALTATLVWQPSQATAELRVIDVGTGGGIPGIPLKIMFPDIRLISLEATAKKTAFLSQLIVRLKLDDVEITTRRAEEAAHEPQYRERFDLVLSRAVARLPTLAELTLPFCAIGSCAVLHKKGDIEEELGQASEVIDILGGKLREVKTVDLPEFTDDRKLVVIEKVSATPEKYPRPPGIPKKRPIV